MGGCGHNGIDDLLVSGAAAKVGGDGPARLRPARFGVFQQKSVGRQDHARRAIAALDGAAVDKSLLQRMQTAVRRGQPLDGRQAAAEDVGDEGAAGA